MAAAALEMVFLEGCKSGSLAAVEGALRQGCDVNCHEGWGLRRAVRYGHQAVWQLLLSHRDLQPNLCNQWFLTALHTACRFNRPAAVADLLNHPAIEVNPKSNLGSSPVMVAAKYCRKDALAGLIRDRRVDLDTVDSSGRTVEQAVGKAVEPEQREDTAEILENIARERQGRAEEEGRRNSLEEESMDMDGIEKSRLFKYITDLVEELRGMHQIARLKLVQDQEAESLQFVAKLEQEFVALLARQQQQQQQFLSRVTAEKKEFDSRQQERLGRLLKSQEQEVSLKEGYSSFRQSSEPLSPRSAASKGNSRRPSLKTHAEQPSCETLSDSSGPSLWEWTVPDEGYCTGNAAPGGVLNSQAADLQGEVPVMVDSARKELECPICTEVMRPPARIWQCKVGHVICEPCKDRVRHQQLSAEVLCPTCKTAPFIGRNLALERISRSLFMTK